MTEYKYGVQKTDKTKDTSKSLHITRQTVALNVQPGSFQQIIIAPTVGTIARIRFASVYLPGIAAATTGTQSAEFSITATISYSIYAFASAVSASPTGSTSTIKTNPGVIFDPTNPLVLTIFNNTDQPQTQTAAYDVIWEEEVNT